jgi:hypothetical protein
MKILVKAIITIIALAPLAVGCGTAGAATITLSDLSSDGTPAGVLSATLEFTVSDSILTLNVTNDTSAPNEYIINQVYFNAGDTIEGLTLTSNSDWSLLTDTAAGGFGVFDFFLDGGTGNDPNLIQPGGTQTFTFGIGGTGPFSDTDFVAYSTIPPGNTVAQAAAKFIGGPAGNDPDEEDEDSGFGAAVPIPGSVLLLGSGLIGLIFLRRKRLVKSLNR